MLFSIVGEKTDSGKNHTAGGCQGSGLNSRFSCWETVFHGSLKTLTAHNTFLRMFKK